MPVSFEDAQFSISNAERHLNAFKDAVRSFIQSNPYGVVREPIFGTNEEAIKIVLLKPLPEFLRGIAFDFISNLRASLDQSVFAIGGGKGHKFTFGDTESEIRGRKKTVYKDVPDSIFDLMVSYGPYVGGNAFLWALNKLCNGHKHEVVIPVGIYSGGMRSHGMLISGASKIAWPPIWDSRKNEMVVAQVQKGGAFHGEVDFAFHVAINKIGVLESMDAVAVFDEFLRVTNSIVFGLEEESRRLGLLS